MLLPRTLTLGKINMASNYKGFVLDFLQDIHGGSFHFMKGKPGLKNIAT